MLKLSIVSKEHRRRVHPDRRRFAFSSAQRTNPGFRRFAQRGSASDVHQKSNVATAKETKCQCSFPVYITPFALLLQGDFCSSWWLLGEERRYHKETKTGRFSGADSQPRRGCILQRDPRQGCCCWPERHWYTHIYILFPWTNQGN